MKTIYLIGFLLFITISLPAFGQSVTFSGVVERHVKVDKSVEVSGEIRFYYGYSEFVSSPFTIPVGQRSVAYEQIVDWSLAGSIDTDHDFFRVSVICEQNCELGNVANLISYLTSDGQTANDFYVPEKFGESIRESAYIVNLTLLPRFAEIEGVIKLPDDKSTSEDLSIKLVGLAQRHLYLNRFIKSSQQVVTISAGESQVSFKFLVDTQENKQSLNGGIDEYNFGYLCESELCDSLQLVKAAFIDFDGDRLTTSRLHIQDINLKMVSSNNSYQLNLPKPIELLDDMVVPVTISRSEKTLSESNIVGKVVIEKHTNFQTCDFSTTVEIDYSSNERCEGDGVGNTVEIVSETSFTIPFDHSSVSVLVPVEPMEQDFKFNNNTEIPFKYLDHQRIKVVCESGCEAPLLLKTVYFKSGAKYSPKSSGSATKFLLTEDFEIAGNSISIPLDAFNLSGILMLLEDDESNNSTEYE